jgi:hypothetical protein
MRVTVARRLSFVVVCGSDPFSWRPSCSFVSQVAGKLLGLMPGDLGDLGEASLSYETILYLLDILIKNIGTRHATMDNLSDAYKLLLELTVRLLACAQRMYLVRNEWNEIEDLTQEIILHIEGQPNPDDYLSLEGFDNVCPSISVRPSLSVSTLSESPSLKMFLCYISAVSPESCFPGRSMTGTSSLADSGPSLEVDIHTSSTKYLIEALALSRSDISFNERTLISMLHILCASSEVFPLGNCWTTSTQNNWRVLSLSNGNGQITESLIANGCSISDLAVIVESVCSVLGHYGNHGASSEVQHCTLLSLIRLTVSTEEVSLQASELECIILSHAWRRVWTTIHNSSHCYHAKTQDTSSGSIGELVLLLLTQMIRFSCTDLPRKNENSNGFLNKRQCDVWNLKVFEQIDIQNQSPLMLLYASIVCIDLSDVGRDTVGLSVSHEESWNARLRRFGRGRRSKLLCYCLHVLLYSPAPWNDDSLISVTFACIAALVNGFSVCPSLVYKVTNPIGIFSVPSLPQDILLSKMLQVVELESFLDQHLDEQAELFFNVWRRPLQQLDCLGFSCISRDSMDCVYEALRMIHLSAFFKECRSKSTKAIGSSESARFLALVLGELELSRESVVQIEGVNPCLSTSLSRTSTVKGYLTVLLSHQDKHPSSLWKGVVDDVSLIFNETSDTLISGFVGSTEFEDVLSDLVQIVRGLVSVNASVEFLWPECLIQAIPSLYAACEVALDSYVAADMCDCVAETEQSTRAVVDIGTSLDDDVSGSYGDREGADTTKRKMRWPGNHRRQKRLHTSEILSFRFSRRCASLIGSLLLELNPIYKDFEFVAKQLLGVDLLGEVPLLEYDVDVLGGIDAVKILSKKDFVSLVSVCNEEVTNEYDSMPSLICGIIRLVRLASNPSVSTHMFGYSYCANVVSRRAGSPWSTALTCNEAKDVLELITVSDSRKEWRSLTLRPFLRSIQVQAATEAFIKGDDNFHAEIDSLFGMTFVLPMLSDLNSNIRHDASIAVAAALSKLSEDKVVESVRRRLSPVTGQITDEYRRWYTSKNAVAARDESISLSENQIWDDAFASMQYDTVSCWCVVAETTSTRDILQQILFDLVLTVVAHSNLEDICFNALARIAHRRGFTTVEQLLNSEMRGFFQRWIEAGFSFYEIPMMICIPSTFQRLLRAGQSHLLKADAICSRRHRSTWDFQKIRETALSEFLKSYAKHAFPQIIISSVKSLAKASITKDGRRRLLDSECFRDYCSVIYGHFSDDVARKTLRVFIPIIMAEASFDEPSVAADLSLLLKGLLTELLVQQKCDEGASLSLRRVLEIAGEMSPCQKYDGQESFWTLFKVIGMKPEKSCFDMIRAAGSSIPELLALARFLLDTSCTERQKNIRWKSADVIFCLLLDDVDHSARCSEIYFCLDFLLCVVLDPNLLTIRIDSLGKLKEFLQCLPLAKLSEGMQDVYYFKKIFRIIMGLHRQCQNDIFAKCVELHRARDKEKRRRRGILSLHESCGSSFDLWDWTVAFRLPFNDLQFPDIWEVCSRYIPSALTDFVVESFNVLEIIVQKSSSLNIFQEVVGYFCFENFESSTFSAFGCTKPSFSAQQLVLDTLRKDSISTDDFDVDGSNLEVWLSNQISSDHSFVTSELKEFENFLRHSRTQEGRLRLTVKDERTLIRALNRFCSKSMPEDARIAASRCLGEIQIESDYSNTDCGGDSAELDCLSMAINSDRLLNYLQSLVVVVLAKATNHKDARTSMVAIDTLKCLLASRLGRSCIDMISDPVTTGILRQMVSNARPVLWNGLFLNRIESSRLRSLAPLEYDEKSREWCWDDFFWLRGPRTVSFESWICRLVSSLLVCCYDIPAKFISNGNTSNFFALCQRMSYLDPTTAQAMFPAIVLDLLLRDGFDCANGFLDSVLVDTWIGRCDSQINIHFSRCFSLVLRQCSQEHHLEAVELVVDILDMLRRLIQHRFVTSVNHKMNKRRSKEMKSSRVSLDGTGDVVEFDPWRGAPFGVVLQLDGIVVANACIRAKRFEAAIFYAELFVDTRFGDPQWSSGRWGMDQSSRSGTRYISGFYNTGDENIESDRDAFALFEILRQCYTSIGDDDAREAAAQLESDLSFASEQGTNTASSSTLRDPPSIRKLQLLDSMAMRDRHSQAITMSVVHCFDGLGLRNSLETYICGLTASRYGRMASDDCDNNVLLEKMYECRLYRRQWDDVDDQNVASTDSESDTLAYVDSYPLNSNVRRTEASNEAGFYELLVGAIDLLRCSDFETSRKLLLNARLRFVDRLTTHGSESSLYRNVCNSIDHLRTLNDIEDFVQNPESSDVVQRMITPADNHGDPRYRSPFSDCIREIVTRFIRSKKAIVSSGVVESLAVSLMQRFLLQLQDNRHDAAEASLQRLSSLNGTSDDSSVRLQLRLCETRLLESKGDYNVAIRHTKLLVNSLRQSTSSAESDVVLLADALLFCGEWMTKYKVEPAGSILANYLQPAAAESIRIYNANENVSNADRATRALLAQGQLVSNLFDAVSSRVQSVDWQKAEASLNDREAECKKLDDEAKQKKSSQSKKKRESTSFAPDDLNIQIYRHNLKREIKTTRIQRNGIVSSLEAHRTLAINSIGTALAIAGVSGADDMSKHVYRLVGIWFSSENAWSEDVDDVTSDALDKIPTFRFVPLVAQLLSRVANVKTPPMASFQNRLQDLILKMSRDHPYHCILHLLTLSYSKHTMDKNDKGEDTNFILHRLMNDDPVFLAELIQGYKTVSNAYIHLAKTNVTDFKRRGANRISFDKVCKASNLRLDKCLGSGARKAKYLPCILTKPPMIRPGRDYGNGIDDPIGSEHVDTFESTFAITDTGVNQPKIVVCVGTKQGRFKQLVKGADDTRQDAVMEQVFGYANEILARRRQSNNSDVPSSHGNALRLVTYNVVPLNHVAGVSDEDMQVATC